MVQMPATAHYSLKLSGCCVSFALKSDTADIRICLLNCMWADKTTYCISGCIYRKEMLR